MSRPPHLLLLYPMLPPQLFQPCSSFRESSGYSGGGGGGGDGSCQHLAVEGPGSEEVGNMPLFEWRLN